MKKTAGEIRELIKDIPDDMPVDFSPITSAWLGTMGAMRAKEIHIYTHDGWKTSTFEDPTAKCTIYLYEDDDD